MMWKYNYTDPDILEHYGILGMKWGVRRFQDKNGRLTSAGKKRYDDETSNSFSKKSSFKASKEVGDSLIERKLGIKLSDRAKTAIKVGAGITAVALVAYGGYRLYNSDVGKPIRDYVDGVLKQFEDEAYIKAEKEDRIVFQTTGKLTEHAKKDLSTRDYDSNVMEHDPEQARSFRQAVINYRKQYKANTGYDLSLDAARNVVRKYYNVKV